LVLPCSAFAKGKSSSGSVIRNLSVLGDKLLFTAPNGVDAAGLSTDDELYTLSVMGSN